MSDLIEQAKKLARYNGVETDNWHSTHLGTLHKQSAEAFYALIAEITRLTEALAASEEELLVSSKCFETAIAASEEAKLSIDNIEPDDGFWKSCSGCHETSEGAETGAYPYSKVFNCYLGAGCRECGGLGAVWDGTDYSDLGDFIAASEEARRAERAAVVRECSEKAEVYRDSATGGMAAIADTIARSIREIATDADTSALDKLLREARMEGMERAALAVTERADQEDEFATIHEKRGNGYKAGKAARVVTTLRGVAAHIRILAALEAPQ